MVGHAERPVIWLQVGNFKLMSLYKATFCGHDWIIEFNLKILKISRNFKILLLKHDAAFKKNES